MNLTDHAYELLKSNPTYLDDARAGRGTNNTVVGSVMSITTHSPRWATEEAVTAALKRIQAEGKKKGQRQ